MYDYDYPQHYCQVCGAHYVVINGPIECPLCEYMALKRKKHHA